MPEVYDEKPEVLEVGKTIDGEFVPQFYLVGRSREQIQSLLSGAPCVKVANAKPRRPRRTKSEMRGAVIDGDAFHGDKNVEGVPRPHHKEAVGDKAWPA